MQCLLVGLLASAATGFHAPAAVRRNPALHSRHTRAERPHAGSVAAAASDPLDGTAMIAGWARYAEKPGARFRALAKAALRTTFEVRGSNRVAKKQGAAAASPARTAAARRAVAELLRLGPTYIKLGQIASCRTDVLASEYIDELKTLQDDVPAFEPAVVERIVAAELGRPLDAVFATFDLVPIKSASLGQVHRATLKDGGAEVGQHTP